ncbi:hypothetical protein DH86_00003387 [Scytalidium sp. 3C]|nr:hypothetical protein DH86_00003387 [Scytalidium sp. 3C]
MRTQLNNHSIT